MTVGRPRFDREPRPERIHQLHELLQADRAGILLDGADACDGHAAPLRELTLRESLRLSEGPQMGTELLRGQDRIA